MLSSSLEYKSRYRDVLHLIQDQAAMTAAVIAQSGSNQAFLTEEIKQTYIDRALDVLYILNEIDRERQLSIHDLDEWVNNETILEIVTYDQKGKQDGPLGNTSKQILKESDNNSAWVLDQLKPILSKNTDLVIAGVDQDTTTSQGEFLVIIPRDRGGAISCQLTVDAEQEFKYLTTMEIGLEDLLYVKGLEYLQLSLDDYDPYYVSRSNEHVDDTWDREALDDILFMVSKGKKSILEVVRPVLFNASLGEVRIGFNAEALLSIRGQIIYQVLLRTALLTLLAFAILVFLLARQNATLLSKEKARIEAEVYRLEKKNRLREKQVAVGELAAGVAHEIRNPLNAIGIVAQRLKREFSTGEDQEEFESLTGTMVSEISRINASLQDFLDYTRPTPLNFAPLDTEEFLASIAKLYESEGQKKEITIINQAQDFAFEADAEYLRQAISNLVRNALDACDGGDRIDLNAVIEDEKVMITIQDTGRGIPEDQLPRVFDLYYTTKDMGTGVGLALTHKIIADHNGTIEVTSQVGQGSTFKIELPVKQ